MPFLEWSEELDVQVDDMNDQHEELIRLMNAVHEANARRAGKEVIRGVLGRLVNYVVRHFAEEEAYMASIGFPKLDSHKLIHQQLLEKVADFQGNFENSGAETLSDEFFDFLRFWLVSHIKGVDLQYGRHSAQTAA